MRLAATFVARFRARPAPVTFIEKAEYRDFGPSNTEFFMPCRIRPPPFRLPRTEHDTTALSDQLTKRRGAGGTR